MMHSAFQKVAHDRVARNERSDQIDIESMSAGICNKLVETVPFDLAPDTTSLYS